MHLTEDDLRAIWRDLYMNVVMTSGSHVPDLVHRDARETADSHIALLRADMKAASDKVRVEEAASPPAMQPVPVSSLKVGDRVLLLGTVDYADDNDPIPAAVALDGDESDDGWTRLRRTNIVYRAGEAVKP